MLTIPDGDEDGLYGQYTCGSVLEHTESNNINILPTPRKRATSFNKVKEKNLDIFLHDDIRPRTHSMPTRSSFRKPDTRHLQLARLRLNKYIDNETYNVRSFEISSKGVITKRPDSIRTKSTNSIYSPDGDFLSTSPQSIISSSLSKESLRVSPNTVSLPALPPIHVMILGEPGVGKTGLAQQFMTLEYLGGFNTSVDEL
jgi:hypothetical protein